MKKTIFFLLSCLSFMAHSEVVFKKNSAFDLSLKPRMIKSLYKACPKLASWQVEEVGTILESVKNDQFVDRIYTTNFLVYGTEIEDGHHPRIFTLMAKTSVTNGYDHDEQDWFSVDVYVLNDANGICL